MKQRSDFANCPPAGSFIVTVYTPADTGRRLACRLDLQGRRLSRCTSVRFWTNLAIKLVPRLTVCTIFLHLKVYTGGRINFHLQTAAILALLVIVAPLRYEGRYL